MVITFPLIIESPPSPTAVTVIRAGRGTEPLLVCATLSLTFNLTPTLGREDRRCRTSYTSSQLHTLIKAFMKNPYPGVDSREQLAQEIGVPESRVQVSDKEFVPSAGDAMSGRGAVLASSCLWPPGTPPPQGLSGEGHFVWQVPPQEPGDPLSRPFQLLPICQDQCCTSCDPSSAWHVTLSKNLLNE